jgi:1-deoxy-D-xylulose-5-phosphate synthase
MLFEALRFEYIGPISGHDFGELIPILRNLEHLEGPVLVHVLTKKGKGYKPAEERPDLYHGVGPFDIETGEIQVNLNCPMSYTKVFGNTLIRLASEDKKIVAITAAMPEGTGLNDFSEKFPERFFDVGIAEQHAVTFAAGLASEGLSPVVAIYSTFLQRAYDQIAHDVCLSKLPVTFALDRGGIVGEDGPTHHGLFDFAYLRHLPNMVVMAPKDENELQHMLYTAVKHPGPAAVRYPRGAGEGIPLDQRLNIIPIGKAEVLREGDDLLILAIGVTVNMAVQAAKLLAESGISATVVNSRFVKPLDEELIISKAQRSKAVLTVEEHVLDGGFGSAILELFERRNILDKPLKRIGVPDRFVEHGSQKKLRERYGLTAESIAEAALSLLKG